MRKIVIAITVFIYLIVSSGFAINVHYCMGKLAYVDFHDQIGKCGKCGMKTTGGSCCKHVYKVVKLADIHKLISNNINLCSSVDFINNYQIISDTDLTYSEGVAGFKSHSPPRSQGNSLYIINCVFRI